MSGQKPASRLLAAGRAIEGTSELDGKGRPSCQLHPDCERKEEPGSFWNPLTDAVDEHRQRLTRFLRSSASFPRLLMPSNFCLPPVEYCPGTNPSQAELWLDMQTESFIVRPRFDLATEAEMRDWI